MLRASLFALSLLTAYCAPAYATGFEATQTVEVAIITVADDGAELISYEVAEEVAPGDQLRYTISYVNNGEDAASSVKLDMPVPSEVTYLEGTAIGADAAISFSTDGETFAPRSELSVNTDDGPAPATAEDITHVRWTFASDIEPGGEGKLSYSGVLK